VEHGNYRGRPGVVFRLKDETTGVEGDVLESHGGGPAVLVGIVLRVISVVRQPGMSRMLVMDEPTAQVSPGYREATGKFLRKLCEPPPRGLGFKMLIVTHEDIIADEAHKRYRATKSDDGKTLILTEESNDE